MENENKPEEVVEEVENEESKPVDEVPVSEEAPGDIDAPQEKSEPSVNQDPAKPAPAVNFKQDGKTPDANAAPRDPKVIEKECQMLFIQCGGIQFEIELKKNQLNHLNQRLHYLNNEMAEWNAIEQEKKASAAKNTARQVQENLRKAEEKRLRKGAKADTEATLQ